MCKYKKLPQVEEIKGKLYALCKEVKIIFIIKKKFEKVTVSFLKTL